ncbi:hypothetical protein [Micromonospora wenchangensis]|uniref:hypothetical protein n=1 Tax=Micromonospora wenchangensis TaxID=1185415 RepID=UPI003D747CE7
MISLLEHTCTRELVRLPAYDGEPGLSAVRATLRRPDPVASPHIVPARGCIGRLHLPVEDDPTPSKAIMPAFDATITDLTVLRRLAA